MDDFMIQSMFGQQPRAQVPGFDLGSALGFGAPAAPPPPVDPVAPPVAAAPDPNDAARSRWEAAMNQGMSGAGGSMFAGAPRPAAGGGLAKTALGIGGAAVGTAVGGPIGGLIGGGLGSILGGLF